MKYTINGFSQEAMVDLGLKLDHAQILRWFVDFKDSGNMVTEIIGSEKYYWIKYDGIIEDLPILNINKDTIYRKLKKLVSVGILKHVTVKRCGTYSFYSLGDNYKTLEYEDAHKINNKSYLENKILDSYNLKLTDEYSNLKQTLNCKCGVYFLCNEIGNVEYIGKSSNLFSRIISSSLERKIYNFKFVETETISDSHLLEACLICRHKPFLNKDMVSNDELTIDIDCKKYINNISKTYTSLEIK